MASEKHIYEKVTECILDVMPTTEEVDIKYETVLEDDLAIDSLSKIEAALYLEDEFDISIDDEKFAQLNTVGDVVHYIKSIV